MYAYLCMCFARLRERKGEVTAKQLATASHPSPTHAQWMLLCRISAETAGIVTTWIQHLQHTATWREAGSQRGARVGEDRERAKLSESDEIYVKSTFMKTHIWCGALQRSKDIQEFNETRGKTRGMAEKTGR